MDQANAKPPKPPRHERLSIPLRFNVNQAVKDAEAGVARLVVDATRAAGELELICAKRGEQRTAIAEARAKVEQLPVSQQQPYLDRLAQSELKLKRDVPDVCTVAKTTHNLQGK